nr:uncharacterized protein LOC123774202 [Procambarus clarkii]
MLATLAGISPSCLNKSVLSSKSNGIPVSALIDTGSSENFIHKNIAEQSGLLVYPDNGAVSIATVSFSSKFLGQCSVDLELQGETYHGVNLKVLPDLCADVISGHNFLQNHFVLEIAFEGYRPPLRICGLTAAKVPAPSLFSNLAPDCKSIAVKSRRYSEADKLFIESETARMLREEIIRPSRSPWSAQVLVIKGEHHKKRMAVDYSQTINRFTGLDAYPLPHIDEIVNNVARFKVYSTPDLRSAYQQVGLTEEEKPYTAFEACGKLFEFNRIPFGVTNGVASFQIVIDGILEKEGVKGTFAYVDDVCVCGDSEEEHDKNLKHFMYVARRYNLTLNLEKCSFRLRSIKLLGYLIQEGENRPDPERLEPLLKLPLPSNTGSLRRTMGMLAHYSRWVLGFSEKIRPLSHANGFPLSAAAAKAFEGLKQDIAEAVVRAIDPTAPFAVETDASDHAIAATLTQNDQPVAFFSRTLSNSEQRHSSVKKEAYAIVEALRKWRYYLIGRHFRLVTDQRSVAFMFNSKSADKIKNDKIARWRVELSCYHYDTVYRPSKQNIPTDAFSRVCGATNVDELKELHDNLCHPEVSRMAHFDRCRNLPYSVEELKKMTNSCSAFSELKPRFCKFDCGHLIKATQPFERLKIDFKGPLTSHSRNKYILTVVDEFSRFPFAFPCSDMTTGTVIQCLVQLFAIFGMPAYIHSDRGTSFMSVLKNFLLKKGVATSITTLYSPKGNGQPEKYNGIIWKTVLLALRTRGLDVSQCEVVLPDALHSIRSLLCTSTNCTPYKRFFRHTRRSTSGRTLPTWLACRGPVLLKCQVRQSKNDPLVDEVEVVDVNPE